MRTIPNDELRPGHLPPADALSDAIFEFASTFNGYDDRGSLEKCGDVANACQSRYKAEGALPADLTDLRTCLFFEFRRWHHFGEEPDEPALAYLRALVEAVRSLVSASELQRHP